MSSVMYVHTKRFVAEIQAFFNHFTQLQAVMKSIRAATTGQMVRSIAQS
jgi:vacuolar protein sorting-associated protein 13D